MVPQIGLSVITSFRVPGRDANDRLPLEEAARLLRRKKVELADLYCFFPGDLTADVLKKHVGQAAPETVASQIARLDVQALLRKWGANSDISHFLSGKRVRALASNLPNISSPIDSVRQETVLALENLLHLAHKIGATVVEIVVGPNFVRGANPKRHEFRTGPTALKQRRDALIESLVALNNVAARLRPKVAIALETEPGLSYLLNSWKEIETVFNEFEAKRRNASCLFLNLDIGHARLFAAKDPSMFAELSSDTWCERIVHAHISHHTLNGHLVDLPLSSEHQETYQPWIDLLVDAWCLPRRSSLVSNAIALELEAASSEDDVWRSLKCLRKWVEHSRRRRMAAAGGISLTHVPERPISMKEKTVVTVDLCGYSSILVPIEAHLDAGAAARLNERIQRLIGLALRAVGLTRKAVAKTTGDGAILLFDSAEAAHKFATGLLELARQHNAEQTDERSHERFRIGMATGQVARERDLDGNSDIAGVTISNSVRMQTAAEPMQVVADASAYRQLPDSIKLLYGYGEEVIAKHGQKFVVHRYPRRAEPARGASTPPSPRRASSAPAASGGKGRGKPPARGGNGGGGPPDGEIRKRLFLLRSRITKSGLELVMFLVGVPTLSKPSDTLDLGDRYVSVLNWAEGPGGCGLAALEEAIRSLDESD